MSWLVHLLFTRCLSAHEVSYVTTRAIWRSVRIKTRSGRKLDGVTGEQRKNYLGSHAIRTRGQWKEVTEIGHTCSRRVEIPFWSVTYANTCALGEGVRRKWLNNVKNNFNFKKYDNIYSTMFAVYLHRTVWTSVISVINIGSRSSSFSLFKNIIW